MQRRRTSSATWMVAFGASLLLVGACADDSEASPRDEMVDQMMEAIGVDESTASCLVDGLIDELGSERSEELVTAGDDPEDLSDDEEVAVGEVTANCLGDQLDDPGVTIDPEATDPEAVDPEVTTGG